MSSKYAICPECGSQASNPNAALIYRDDRGHTWTKADWERDRLERAAEAVRTLPNVYYGTLDVGKVEP